MTLSDQSLVEQRYASLKCIPWNFSLTRYFWSIWFGKWHPTLSEDLQYIAIFAF